MNGSPWGWRSWSRSPHAASKPPSAASQAAKAPAADVAAGKAFAQRECAGCHGLDGKGAAPAIPHLAAQRERYLVAALNAYREGKRTHAALKQIAAHMSESDARNLSAYYAALPPVQAAPAGGRNRLLRTNRERRFRRLAPSAMATTETARRPASRASPASSRTTSWSRSRST